MSRYYQVRHAICALPVALFVIAFFLPVINSREVGNWNGFQCLLATGPLFFDPAFSPLLLINLGLVTSPFFTRPVYSWPWLMLHIFLSFSAFTYAVCITWGMNWLAGCWVWLGSIAAVLLAFLVQAACKWNGMDWRGFHQDSSNILIDIVVPE